MLKAEKTKQGEVRSDFRAPQASMDKKNISGLLFIH